MFLTFNTLSLMKIFIPKISWIGNWGRFFERAFDSREILVVSNSKGFKLNHFVHKLKLHQICPIREYETRHFLKKYNETIIQECVAAKPDVFMVMNESKLFPSTIKEIRDRCKCKMVLILADDPWDSARYVADFPHSLKYFDIIFNGEPAFVVNIKRVAPLAKVFWNLGGFDPDYYFPLKLDEINSKDKDQFGCEISFTGSSYGNKAEGAYRADILSYLADFDLKIWGDDNWPYRFRYLPDLSKCFKGTRLPYDDLRKLYGLTKINLNLPAPQVLTSFQPRVFEIAACKGFQIVDHRPLIRKIFTEDEVVTFDSIDELRDKITYYVTHETERNVIAERLYKKVVENYTWSHWAKKVVNTIRFPENYECLF